MPSQLPLVAPVRLHFTPHPPQFAVVVTGVSQPSRSGSDELQLPHPALQLVYVQVVPVHDAPLLLVVSHARPQPLQSVMVFVDVSQPLKSLPPGSQFAKPVLQPVYVHLVPPLHIAPRLFATSQLVLHEPHTAPAGVSQPFAFVPLVSQSKKPGLHPVYVHFVPSHPAPRLFVVSHADAQAPQLVSVSSLVSQPSSGAGAAGSVQFPKPAAHVDSQNPATHAAVATFVLEHGRSHAPHALGPVSQLGPVSRVSGVSALSTPSSKLESALSMALSRGFVLVSGAAVSVETAESAASAPQSAPMHSTSSRSLRPISDAHPPTPSASATTTPTPLSFTRQECSRSCSGATTTAG